MAQKREHIFLWAIIAVVPVILMSASFLFDQWSWGLMDDVGLLRISHEKAWWPSVCEIVKSSFSGQDGKLTWVYYAYAVTFYPIFENAPRLFYFFKLFIAVVSLLIWGFNVRLLTNSWLGALFLCVVAFSFYNFYDAIFYLSTHEILGVFFLGVALTAFITGVIRPVAEGKRCSWPPVLLGWLCLLLACGSKEPFVFTFLGLGVGLGLWAWLRRRWDVGLQAFAMIASSVLYGLVLKIFIQKGYTARYNPTDFPVLWANLCIWWRDVALFHLPWMALIVLIIILQRFRKIPIVAGSTALFGILTGSLFYIFYLLVILPWQANSYHVVSLGVFFAFVTAVAAANFLEHSSGKVLGLIALGGLVFEILVCSHSFGAMATYRNDSADLVKWMKYNHQFQRDMAEGWRGATNAIEAGETFPKLLEKQSGAKIEPFYSSFNVKGIICDPKVVYYLYDPKLGDQDLRRLEFMWSVAFESKSWTLFRRSFWADIGCSG